MSGNRMVDKKSALIREHLDCCLSRFEKDHESNSESAPKSQPRTGPGPYSDETAERSLDATVTELESIVSKWKYGDEDSEA